MTDLSSIRLLIHDACCPPEDDPKIFELIMDQVFALSFDDLREALLRCFTNDPWADLGNHHVELTAMLHGCDRGEEIVMIETMQELCLLLDQKLLVRMTPLVDEVVINLDGVTVLQDACQPPMRMQPCCQNSASTHAVVKFRSLVLDMATWLEDISRPTQPSIPMLMLFVLVVSGNENSAFQKAFQYHRTCGHLDANHLTFCTTSHGRQLSTASRKQPFFDKQLISFLATQETTTMQQILYQLPLLGDLPFSTPRIACTCPIMEPHSQWSDSYAHTF